MLASDLSTQPPSDIVLSSSALNENNPEGTEIGVFSTVDGDADDTFTYQFVSGDGDTHNHLFEIVGDTLKSGVVFDHESLASCTIRIMSTDSGGESFSKAFVIDITDVNEAPTGITLSNVSVRENMPTETVVGYLNTEDTDKDDSFAYEFSEGEGDANNSMFRISGNLLITNASFDFEEKNQYTVRITSVDSGGAGHGLSVTSQFTIHVTDESITASTHVFDTKLSPNDPIATLASEGSLPVTYELIEGIGANDNAKFRISGETIYLSESLNSPDAERYSVRVRAVSSDAVTSTAILAFVGLPGLEGVDVVEGKPLTGTHDGSAADHVYAGTGGITFPGQNADAIMFATINDSLGTNRIVAVQQAENYTSWGIRKSDVVLGDARQEINVWVDRGNYAYGIDGGSMILGSGDSAININLLDSAFGGNPEFYWQTVGIQDWVLNAGGGDDSLNVNIETTKNESFWSYGTLRSTIDVGDGNDHIRYSVLNSANWPTNIGILESSYFLGEGDDRLEVLSSGTGIDGSTVNAGGGNDIFDITASQTGVINSSVSMESGDDVVVIRCSSGNHPDLVDSLVLLGAGDDYIDIGSAINSRINGGDGFDILRLRSPSTVYTQTTQPDGSVLITRQGDAFFSLQLDDIELIQFGDLVTYPVYAGAPLSGYLTGTADGADLYYGRRTGYGIDELHVNDTYGPDAVIAISEGGYVATAIANSDLVFHDQDVSLSAEVTAGYYQRAFGWSNFSSGDGATAILLTTGAVLEANYLESGLNYTDVDLGGGRDEIDILLGAVNQNGTLGDSSGIFHSTLDMGDGTDIVRVQVGLGDLSPQFRGLWGGAILLGAGDDVMTISSRGVGLEASPWMTSTFDAGEGDDFVWISTQFATVVDSSFTTGSGGDVATLLTQDVSQPTVRNSTIDMGQGDDVLTVNGRSDGGILDGGDGYDVLKLVGRQSDYVVTTLTEGGFRIVFDGDEDSAWIARNFEDVVVTAESGATGQASFEIVGPALAFTSHTVRRLDEDPQGIPLDSYSITWQWSPDGTSWSYAGRGSSFLPSEELVGGFLRAEVSYVDGSGAREVVYCLPTAAIARGTNSDPTPLIPTFTPEANVLTEPGATGVLDLSTTTATTANASRLSAAVHIIGNDFGNFLEGGAGDDTVDGGADSDIFGGGFGPGNDIYNGGDGKDLIRYTSATRPIVVNLAEGFAEGDDIDLDIITGIEDVIGGQGPDLIVGDIRDNDLWGHLGDDSVRGGGGIDNLWGGDGDDLLEGGSDDDYIDGGQGSDVAVFNGARSEYVVKKSSSGYVILDTVPDRDGKDTIVNVEGFSFLDGQSSSPLDVVLDVAVDQEFVDPTSWLGDERLIKRGPGRLVLGRKNSHSGGLRVEEGVVVLRHVDAINGGELSIANGAAVFLEVGVSLINISSLSLGLSTLIDIGRGGMTVSTAGFSGDAVREFIVSGRGDGRWNGDAGICSQFAGESHSTGSLVTGTWGIGYLVDTGGTITIQTVLEGDTNLDGSVDFDDIINLFPYYGGEGSFVWGQGDVTYDGQVDFDDIIALFPNYGAASGGSVAGLASAGSGAGGGLELLGSSISVGSTPSGPGFSSRRLPLSESGEQGKLGSANSSFGVFVGPIPFLADHVQRVTPIILSRPSSSLSRLGSLDATMLAFAGLVSDKAKAGSGPSGFSVGSSRNSVAQPLL